MSVLTTIQSELKCPKNQRNTFGNYNYRNCEDILEALKPLLLETESYINLTDDVIVIADRFYVKATASLFDKDDKLIASSVGMAREELSKKGQDASQTTGSTSSYARKYALNGLFGIDDTKDSDSTNTHGKEEQATQKQAPVQSSSQQQSQTQQTPVTPIDIKKAAITRLCKTLYAGKMKDKVMEVVKEYAPTGNPNSITDLEVADALYVKLNKLAEEAK